MNALSKLTSKKRTVETSMPFYEKYLVMFELFSIIIFIFITIVEIVYALQLLNLVLKTESTYVYQLMTERLKFQNYIAGVQLIKKTEKCPIGYEKHVFYRVNTFINIKIENETDSTYYADPKFDILQNNTRLGNQYYKFDYNDLSGNETVFLRNDYEFNTLKDNYQICKLELEITSDAYHLIPNDQECDKFNNNNNTIDCGSYADNSYKFCVDLNYVKFVKNHTNLIDQKGFDHTLYPEGYYCPINKFKQVEQSFIIVKRNQVYLQEYTETEEIDEGDDDHRRRLSDDDESQNEETKESEIKPIDKDEYMKYVQKNTEEVLSDLFLEQEYDNLFDNAFFVLYDPPAFTNHTNYNDSDLDLSNATIPLANLSDFELIVGQKNGYMDSFSYEVLREEFDEFYNYTYFDKALKLNINNSSYTYLVPNHLEYLEEKRFIRPYTKDKNKNEMIINLFSFKIVSKKCFDNVFSKDNNSNLQKNLKKLRASDFLEVCFTLIAWLFVKLFISIYSNFSVRYKVIQKKYNGTINQADKDSEFISKVIPKCLESIVFVLVIFILLYQDIVFKKIQKQIENFQVNECFTDLLREFDAYKGFITDYNEINSLLLMLIFVSGGLEGFTMLSYMLLYSIDLGMIKKKKVRDNEIALAIDARMEGKKRN